jgi:selenocysteine lyase/cysteine desulfurase
MDWDAWLEEVERARATFARLINASPAHIAISTSVSAIASSVASALDFAGGRETVVVSGMEFPTVAQVWLAQERRGARIARVPVSGDAIDTNAYDGVLNERTLLVSAAHAWFQNGALQDVEEITRRAHDAGALVFVDAYQSMGAVPIDVRALDIDFLASGNLKYLMGVPGIAFLYVRPDLIETLEPTVTGWFGRADPFAFDGDNLDWSDNAARMETGTPPIAAAYIANAGMSLLERIGVDRIRSWTRTLSDLLIEGGRARGLEVLGGTDSNAKTPTTAFRCDDAHAVESRMRERGVIASARGPAVRLAPHYYSTVDDVDTALDTLVDALRLRSRPAH